MLCLCGCGKETNDGKKWLRAHNIKSLRPIHKGYKFKEEVKLKMGRKKGFSLNDIEKKRIAVQMKELWKNKEYKEKMLQRKPREVNIETNKKISQAIKNFLNNNPEELKNRSNRIKSSKRYKGKEHVNFRGGMIKRKYISLVVKAKVLARDNFKCKYCSSENDLEVHHIVPERYGGTGDIENLITLCSEDHTRFERLYDKNKVKYNEEMNKLR